MVESLWAMMIVVLFVIIFSRASCTNFSEAEWDEIMQAYVPFTSPGYKNPAKLDLDLHGAMSMVVLNEGGIFPADDDERIKIMATLSRLLNPAMERLPDEKLLVYCKYYFNFVSLKQNDKPSSEQSKLAAEWNKILGLEGKFPCFYSSYSAKSIINFMVHIYMI